MQRFEPHVVCFEFEHAHATQLRAMRDFKLTNPSLPLLMLTTSHSEALAIWAFRVRVWNYLVKPVSPSELRANFSTLARLVSDDQGPPRSVRSVGALLPGDEVGIPKALRGPSLQAALANVEEHYAVKLRQSVVAASCGMSSYTFSRAFKAQYGMTFSQYLMRYRIGRACRLLRYGSHTATTAGLAVGFNDSSHFARAFRKLLGISPSSYQHQEIPLQPVEERRRRPRDMPGKALHRRAPGALPERRVLELLEEVDGISKRATGPAGRGALRVPNYKLGRKP
jgi:AraC-like DNA-binding protein